MRTASARLKRIQRPTFKGSCKRAAQPTLATRVCLLDLSAIPPHAPAARACRMPELPSSRLLPQFAR